MHNINAMEKYVLLEGRLEKEVAGLFKLGSP